jgi:endonuclease-3
MDESMTFKTRVDRIRKRTWSDFSLQLIFFGREICTARKPKCPTCPLNKLCPWKYKTT